jgi:hypothetical protein
MGTTDHGRHFPVGSPPNESLGPSSPAQPVVAASKPVLPRLFRSEAGPRLVDRGVHQPLSPGPYSLSLLRVTSRLRELRLSSPLNFKQGTCSSLLGAFEMAQSGERWLRIRGGLESGTGAPCLGLVAPRQFKC